MRTHDAHVIKPQKNKQWRKIHQPQKSRKLTPRASDNPQEQETTPSDVTDAGREPGEAKKDTRKTKDSGSTPRGEHNQFTHFSQDPTNVQVNRHSESEMWKNETPPRQLIPYRKCWRSGIGPTLKASQDMVTGTLSWFRITTLAGYKVMEQKQRKRQKQWSPKTLATASETWDTDYSKEFIKACTELNWTHDTSTPHRSDTGVVIERVVRRVKRRNSNYDGTQRPFRRIMRVDSSTPQSKKMHMPTGAKDEAILQQFGERWLHCGLCADSGRWMVRCCVHCRHERPRRIFSRRGLSEKR